MDNGREAQIEAFLNVSGPRLVIHVAGEISHNHQHSPLVASGIHEALHRLFPSEKAKIVNLMPLTKPKRNEDPPFAYFAHNIREDTYNTLVDQRVWRTDFIHLWAYPIEPIAPSYLGFIIDLSSLDDADDMSSVRGEIIALWYKSEGVCVAIRNILSRGLSTDNTGDAIIIDDDEVYEVINRLAIN
ncbi:hypothetical protein PILCRDRAFT_7912 [Piloderma croceum F 1598]|uniref:Uncharacterized protein n=1 Tax=Piloderma croceum (strain F 1598) TaxID=765440 RepID=A0A0C3B8B5_PILCF|nr:hypothetical protein PILCRDRAFT_7912 [Piloderma croceum F 1598]